MCETLEYWSLTGYAEYLASKMEGVVAANAAAPGQHSLVYCDAVKLRCTGYK